MLRGDYTPNSEGHGRGGEMNLTEVIAVLQPARDQEVIRSEQTLGLSTHSEPDGPVESPDAAPVQGALVIQQMREKVLLFIQSPDTSEDSVLAAVIDLQDLPALADFINNPPTGEWNRFDATVATAADLTGT